MSPLDQGGDTSPLFQFKSNGMYSNADRGLGWPLPTLKVLARVKSRIWLWAA